MGSRRGAAEPQIMDIEAVQRIAFIVGPQSAAAMALVRFNELRETGHDTHIAYLDGRFLVKEPRPLIQHRPTEK